MRYDVANPRGTEEHQVASHLTGLALARRKVDERVEAFAAQPSPQLKELARGRTAIARRICQPLIEETRRRQPALCCYHRALLVSITEQRHVRLRKAVTQRPHRWQRDDRIAEMADTIHKYAPSCSHPFQVTLY